MVSFAAVKKHRSNLGVVAALHAGAALMALPWAAHAAEEELGAPRIVQVPVGGFSVPAAAGRVVCGSLPAGWSLEANRRRVSPPSALPQVGSRQVSVRVAARSSNCGKSEESVTFVVTGAWPSLDPAGVVFSPDEGRLELKGRNLAGMRIAWAAAAEEGGYRAETCLEPVDKGNGTEACTIPVDRSLGSDAPLFWLPANAVADPASDLYDDMGNHIPWKRLQLTPARILLTARLVTSDGVDISRGPAVVPLRHPSALASAECAPARCERDDKGVLVRAVPGPATEVRLRLRLAPRVYAMENGERRSTVSLSLPLLACPLSVASGPLLRDVTQPRLVARMDARCGAEAGAMSWAVSGEEAEVRRVVVSNNSVYVLLQTERIVRDRVTVTASRGDGGIIGSATERTIPAPLPRASLELADHGTVAFIPTNRPALVTVAPASDEARFVLSPVPGAYDVTSVEQDGEARIAVRGDANAGGFASLQFGYRVTTLPEELSGIDLAVITEPVQRQVRQASVPAPFAAPALERAEPVGAEGAPPASEPESSEEPGDRGLASPGGGEAAERRKPLAELVCTDEHGERRVVEPGLPYRLPWKSRETCRVVIHRERLREEDGLQEVVLEVEVRDKDGAVRGGSNVRERLVLRPGAEPKVFWIKGGLSQFDRITVSLTHVVDEERYVLSPTTRAGLPSAQWVVIVEGGRFRLYATAAIPAGLFRVTEPSGQINLNFGVLSRMTLLDEFGQENLLGAELGVVGMGLIHGQAGLEDFPATLSIVGGLGVRVPLGSGAAVGVHAWLAYEFRSEFTLPDGSDASRLAFIFGPSISIGNVGTNL